eukprot:3057376-Rhodomonas_salina.3
MQGRTSLHASGKKSVRTLSNNTSNASGQIKHTGHQHVDTFGSQGEETVEQLRFGENFEEDVSQELEMIGVARFCPAGTRV